MNEKMDTNIAKILAIRSPRIHEYKLNNKTPKINKAPANIAISSSITLLTASKGVAKVINDKNKDSNVVAYFNLFSPFYNWKDGILMCIFWL